MTWLQLIIQLLPSIIGIIQQIVVAVASTPAVQSTLSQHVSDVQATLKKAKAA